MTEQLTREQKLQRWGEGPWLDEPDHVAFESSGLPCIIHRNHMGAWCGYAAVPPGHPLHGKGYGGYYDETEDDDDGDYVPSPAADIDVHGGLTYSDKCQGDICHVAKPGEPEDVWWFGFDTAHGGDLVPSMAFHDCSGLFTGGEYHDQSYVTAETTRLAEQLRAKASVPA